MFVPRLLQNRGSRWQVTSLSARHAPYFFPSKLTLAPKYSNGNRLALGIFWVYKCLHKSTGVYTVPDFGLRDVYKAPPRPLAHFRDSLRTGLPYLESLADFSGESAAIAAIPLTP